MKKIFICLLALILSLSLCLSSFAQPKQTEENIQVTESSQAEDYGKSDVVADPLYKSDDIKTLLLISSGAVVFFIFAGVCIHRAKKEINPPKDK